MTPEPGIYSLANMTIDEAINSTAERFATRGVDNSRREATSLMAHAIGKPHSFLIAHPEYMLTESEAATFEDLTTRRAQRSPFQHLTRRQEFYGLEFEVSPDVLIPRPETEILVERAIDLLKPLDEPTFLDLGVGSGCISISMLHEVQTTSAVGVDLSPLALAVAGINAEKHGVADRLTLIEGDLFDNVSGEFAAIVSNPPYIPDGDITTLQAEVRDHEPLLALAGGQDGLDIIRRIIAGAPEYLKADGYLLMEIGYRQSAAVRDELENAGWVDIAFLDDLQGIPRTLVARRPD